MPYLKRKSYYISTECADYRLYYQRNLKVWIAEVQNYLPNTDEIFYWGLVAVEKTKDDALNRIWEHTDMIWDIRHGSKV